MKQGPIVKQESGKRSHRPKGGLRRFLRAFLLGGLAQPLVQERAAIVDGLSVTLFGGLFGLPGYGNYYGLRLLPVFTPHLLGARRRLLKEKDFFDRIEDA